MATTIDPVRRHWTLSAAAMQGRGTAEPWEDLTAEPDGVTYREADEPRAMWIEPAGADPATVLFYLHGGGFVTGGFATHRKLVGHLAKAAGTRALLVTYDYAPEHQHPTQLDQVTTVYEWLLHQADRTVVAGDSVGGWLAVSLALRLRDRDVPLPTALLLISACIDLTQSGASYTTNAAKDPFFAKPVVDGLASGFLGPISAKDPAVDLLQADYTGLPPMHIQVGGDETLLDDSRVLHALARKAGVESTLEVFPGQLHTFQMAAGRVPVADEAIGKLATFVRRHRTAN